MCKIVTSSAITLFGQAILSSYTLEEWFGYVLRFNKYKNICHDTKANQNGIYI